MIVAESLKLRFFVKIHELVAMIVSGFTQKNFEEEYLHGSPLDHKHCVTCVRRTCKIRPDNITSCDLVDCPRGCQSRYHGCKEAEHRLLCPEERILCPNRNCGCPIMLSRKKVWHHLSVCPASVIYCSAEWNRSPIESLGPKEKPTLLLKKVYTDCGQLDTALAMRDHRVLVDMLLGPRRTRRILRNPLTQIYPAAPIGRSSSASVESDAETCDETCKDLSDDEVTSKWNSTQSWLEIQKELSEKESKKQSQLYDASRQTATSLTSTLSLISDCMDSTVSEKAGKSSVQSTCHGTIVAGNESSGPSEGCTEISAQGTSYKPENDVNFSEESAQSLQSPKVLEREIDSLLLDNLESGVSLKDKQVTVIQDNQALDSILSVSMGVECITKYQPKQSSTFTFLCAQEVRRDEFAHHFHAVHNRIQSDLNGWMEQRCPLAYLGCPFSFRRFCPSTPGMTVCHSWLLESFGITSQSPQADSLHRTPGHLLPSHPETADTQSSSESAHVCGGTALSQSLAQPCGSKVTDEQMEENTLFPASDNIDPGSQAESQGQKISMELEASASALLMADTPNTTSLSDVRQDHSAMENTFSSLLDSISLDNNVSTKSAILEKFSSSANASNDCDPKSQYTGNNQKRKVEHNLKPVTAKTSHISNQQHGNQSSCIAPLPSLSAEKIDGKQVIYTGVHGNSCIKVDHVSTIPSENKTNAAAGNSQKVQMNDMPVEIMRYITHFLDSFSLYNLSLVSRRMRELCCSLLQERGVVSLIWEKQRTGGKVSWQIVGKRWSFSTCFASVESWKFTSHNPISDHLVTCPYNQDRFRPSDKFSIIPLNDAPMDIQIRDMLQERLRRRRPVGRPRWYIAAMKTFVERLCENT